MVARTPEPEREYLSLQELQAVSLELLKDFDAFCAERGIEYTLCGGSMLGAARHAGFIPWDDDVDVMMLREEYEKLLALKPQVQKLEGRDLISARDRTFARDFARFVRTDYGKVEEGTRDDDCPFVGIDIFAIDYLPDSEADFARQVKDRNKYRQLLLTCASPFNTGTTFAKRWVRNILRPFANAYGKYRIADKAEAVCMRYDDGPRKDIGIVCGEYGTRERWPLAAYHPVQRIPFEDTLMPAPARYDTYLSAIYGPNYMEVPPPEKQRPSHIKAYRIDGGACGGDSPDGAPSEREDVRC